MPTDDKKPAAKKKRLRFLVGADVGQDRYEEGDIGPATALPPNTRRAWLEQGLVEEVGD